MSTVLSDALRQISADLQAAVSVSPDAHDTEVYRAAKHAIKLADVTLLLQGFDADKAELEGWCIAFNDETEKYEIQRWDRALAFASDADALRWVAYRADIAGGKNASVALAVVRS